MEKITLKALELAGFQNADLIAKIISYVPNPQVAAEMLLGVYQPSQIELRKRFKSYRYSRPNEFVEMIEIDDLGNTIKYLNYKQKTRRVWYLTREDRDNNIYVTERPEKSYDYGDVADNGYTVTDHETDLKNFHESWTNQLSVDEALALTAEWNSYNAPVVEESETELPF